MLMPVWTPLILVHEGTERRRRTDSTRPRNGGAAPSPPANTPAVVVVVHEEADSGMLRVPIRCTVRACSNLSAVYHRGAEGGKKEDRGGTILEGGGRNRFIAPPLALSLISSSTFLGKCCDISIDRFPNRRVFFSRFFCENVVFLSSTYFFHYR